MQASARNEYLKNAVMSASPEQLQLMLYDGALRFSRQGRDAMLQKDYSTSCEKLLRAQRIMVELEHGLKREVNPQLCDQLAALYRYVYGKLVEANLKRDIDALDDALKIIEHQRETWQMLIQKIQTHGSEAQPETELQVHG